MTEYSFKMQEVFKLAQFQAARYDSSYLESWHLLLAMVALHDSIAGLTFAEYENRIPFEEYEAAVILAIGKTPSDTAETVQFLEQSHAMKKVLQFAQAIAEVMGSKDVGTEHVLFAMLLDLDLLASRILELAGFKAKEDGDSVHLLDLR